MLLLLCAGLASGTVPPRSFPMQEDSAARLGGVWLLQDADAAVQQAAGALGIKSGLVSTSNSLDFTT